MSKCISPHGEYSDHELDTAYVCTLCGVLDEDAAALVVTAALEYIGETRGRVFDEPGLWAHADAVLDVLAELEQMLGPKSGDSK